MNEENNYLFQTCVLLIQHFKNSINFNEGSVHSRIFDTIISSDKSVLIGKSIQINENTSIRREHVVPCKVLISESCRLIKEGILSDKDISLLLEKHWKIAIISKEEQHILDNKNELNLKSSMPKDWTFEVGDTYARLKLANIIIK